MPDVTRPELVAQWLRERGLQREGRVGRAECDEARRSVAPDRLEDAKR